MRLLIGWCALVVVPAVCGAQAQEAPFTIILEGGIIYDGQGNAAFVADIGIRGRRIAAIGDLAEQRAGLRLDVRGLAVAPGFIDIHSHALRNPPEQSGLFRHPLAENYIRQGVTTAIGGPDGGSAYPIGEVLAQLETTPSAINFGTLVGHGTVRRLVMGNENRTPTSEELDEMKALVEAAMQEGAFGLSSGLKYVPGAYAETEEVIELAKVAGAYGGLYKSHMRDEGLELLASVEETIRIGEKGGLPTQLTHHKVIGKYMWGHSTETLRMVDEARTRGVDVTIDQYPYIASSTSLTILFPAWSLEGSFDDLKARLNNVDTRARIKEAIIFNLDRDRGGGNPANVAIANCPWDTTLNGKNLAIILEERGQPVTVPNAAELAMELQEKGGFQGIFFAMDEVDVKRIMQHPMTMVASDGGIPTPGVGVPHPRNYGTFPRVLGDYVRQQNILLLEEAIRKMTSLPAQRLRLPGRGALQAGAIADLVVFNPDSIIDTATFQEPHQYATGVSHVVVSGQLVLHDGAMTGLRPGQVLRLTDY